VPGWTQDDVDRRNLEVLGEAQPAEPLKLPREAAKDVPEAQIESECTKLLELDGWRALRTDPVSDRSRGKGFGELGMADHLYIRYGQRRNRQWPQGEEDQVMWIEFKAPGGRVKKHQTLWHARERARGAMTAIAGVDFPASVKGFSGWYRASGLARIAW